MWSAAASRAAMRVGAANHIHASLQNVACFILQGVYCDDAIMIVVHRLSCLDSLCRGPEEELEEYSVVGWEEGSVNYVCLNN